VRVNVAIPEAHVSAPVLNAALEGVTRLNESLIKSRAVPTWDQSLASGVLWRPEPPGSEHFDHAGLVAKRGWGDCDDLAPYAAATLRVTGEDRGARAVVKRSGPKKWHAVVRRSDGSIDDPSLEAGMRPGVRAGVFGATLPTMFDRVSGVDGCSEMNPHIALRPIHRSDGAPPGWQARVDLPWNWQPGNGPGDIAMAALSHDAVSDQALVGACLGAVRLGDACGYFSENHLERMDCIAAACDGVPWEELVGEFGEVHADAAGDVIEGFFGSIMKKAKGLARHGLKLAPDLISFVPGVGPAASMAIRAVSPRLRAALKAGKHIRPSKRKAHLARRRSPIHTSHKPVITYPRPPRRRIKKRKIIRSPSGGSAFVCYSIPRPRGY